MSVVPTCEEQYRILRLSECESILSALHLGYTVLRGSICVWGDGNSSDQNLLSAINRGGDTECLRASSASTGLHDFHVVLIAFTRESTHYM